MSDSLSGVEGAPQKPTRAQLNLAATIYGLCLLAQTDGSSDGSDMASRVRYRMSTRAAEQLTHLGIHSGDVTNEHDALRLAISLKP